MGGQEAQHVCCSEGIWSSWGLDGRWEQGQGWVGQSELQLVRVATEGHGAGQQ